MKQFNNQKLKLFYNIFIAFITIISITMVILDYFKIINIYHGINNDINISIWLFYIIEYIIRIITSHDKKRFFLVTSLDLISLIPGHPIFIFFRIARVIRIIRYYHLFWKFGWNGKLTNKVHQFLYDTGFIYFFSISIIILVISALVFAHFEHYPFKTAMWWAITTATTVGYGDIAPQTNGGRIDAAALMIGGIGFIGLMTSTITNFFTTNSEEDNKGTDDKIDKLSKQVSQLSKQVETLNQEIKHQNHHHKHKKHKKH